MKKIKIKFRKLSNSAKVFYVDVNRDSRRRTLKITDGTINIKPIPPNLH